MDKTFKGEGTHIYLQCIGQRIDKKRFPQRGIRYPCRSNGVPEEYHLYSYRWEGLGDSPERNKGQEDDQRKGQGCLSLRGGVLWPWIRVGPGGPCRCQKDDADKRA